MAKSVSPTEVVVINSFHIELDGGGGDFHVALPYSMVEPIRELLDAGVQSDKGDADVRWSKALREEIMDVNVELKTQLLETQLTLCVSGNLGAAYTGLLILEREKAAFKADPNMQPEFAGYDYILERQLKPEARRDIIAQLKALNVIPTSMIDISDGVAPEILHICKES